MSEPLSKTLDGSGTHPFGDWATGADRTERELPRLRVLHHTDLRRIGACSRPNAALDAGEWLIVGRCEPLFVEPRDDGWERALDDPRISRRQLRVRYLPERGRFEVEPHPEGRRKLGLWLPGAEIRELNARVDVPPGAAIAIEDRMLLGLELCRPRSAPEREGAPSGGDARAGLVGESDVMWRLRDEIADAARFAHPVLVLGETGSGKEMVAQAIHRQSDRRDRPLVIVNCAALPETLAESLLFGHLKGAFTGAGADREGFFRAAHGGTLFLDELGEMPIGVQPKLLRALQDGQITPVGRHDAVSVDVRVIAATNRDPADAIGSGRLREDLYHRLAGHVIRAPSLSARCFDVPELFVAFMAALRRELPGLDWLFPGDLDRRPTLPLGFVLRLIGHSWPGNVRELRNFAELCARKNLDASTFRAPDGQPLAADAAGAVNAAVPPPPRDASCPAPPSLPASSSFERVVAGSTTSADPATTFEREQLAAASRALGLAHKTVAKLFDDVALAALVGGDAGDLEAAAAERLLARLERHDFEQRALAADLEMSPATLVKLMARFRIPRAMDLDEATVNAALTATSGDVEAAARRLRVSAQGLKKRLILLRLRG